MNNKNFFLLLIVIFLVISGCNRSSESVCTDLLEHPQILGYPFSKDTLYVHFQEGFMNDTVIISVDKIPILNKCIITNTDLDLAYQFHFPSRWVDSDLSISIMEGYNRCSIELSRKQIYNGKDTLNFIAVNRRKGNLTVDLFNLRETYE